MVKMEITGAVGRLLRSMECLTVLIVGLSLSVYSDEIKDYVMPSETCGYIVTIGDQFTLTSAKEEPPEVTSNDNAHARYDHASSYPGGVDCEITFRTTKDKKFYIRITHFELEFSDLCENDALKMFDGASSSEGRLLNTVPPNGLCGETLSLPNYFYSTENSVTIKFKTNEANNTYTGFDMVLTPYWQPNKGEQCTEGEFACLQSGKCLTGDAYCNQVTQCEDSSDEPGTEACSAGIRLSGNPLFGTVIALLSAIFIISYQFPAIDRPAQ